MAPKAKPKPSPPPSAAQSTPIEDLFSALDRHVKSFQYDQAVKVADQVLAVSPGDEDAVRCKVVALVKSDAIEKALSAIKGFEALPIPDLGYYKAYCLYRQNKLQEALECLDGQERTSMVLQLESQILYRLGKMDACMKSYDKLQNFKIDSLDLKTNIIAALISAGRATEVQGMMDTLKVKASSSFELAYNTACSLIEKGKYADAEQQLLSARRIGQEMLMDEDYGDDEIEAELAPISVQLAYVQQLLGHTQEAIESYTSIINRNLADASSHAVATNNLISLRGTKDASDSLRKLDQLIEKPVGARQFQFANGLDFKLSQRQKEALFSNRLLLLLQTNKIDQPPGDTLMGMCIPWDKPTYIVLGMLGCFHKFCWWKTLFTCISFYFITTAQELASSLPDMFPDSLTPVLLQAAVHVRGKKVPKAEEILGQFADKFPEKSKLVLLARAQIAAAAGHSQIAAESLSKIPDIQHMPATVATIVSLRERLSDFSSASTVFDSAIKWWKNSMTEDNKLNIIMQEAASFKLNHGREDDASKLYEELVKSQGSLEAMVGLVATAARTDLEKAELYEKKLRPLSGLKGINVESLEKTHGAKHVEGAHVGKMEVSEDVKKTSMKKRKRKRKPRYPKGFDPANPGPPPDPERWLPKRERSSYRPRRKDKRAQVRGSQGAVVREKHEAATAANITGPSSGMSSAKSGHVNASSAKGGSQNATSSDKQSRPSGKSRKKSRS
ncbi:signal recognition particle subunit SRP72-like [Iris pallida]|uniref:Signal recognition particle subunit SRP72 n=1 Tax=Iris pallida TaxID=29817 RepID=A0AAX6EXY0_IRIPA|nr:signal recognition particle subunit SRP72-like [Iris pallida]